MIANKKIKVGSLVVDARESLGLAGAGGVIGMVIDKFKTGEKYLETPNWMCTILWPTGRISNRDQRYLRNVRRPGVTKEKIPI